MGIPALSKCPKKMKLFYFWAAAAMAKRPENPIKRTLQGPAAKAFAKTQEPMSDMQNFYLDGLQNYGKKKWEINAAGIERWVNKMEKAFAKKIAKCGDNYWENPMDPEGNFANSRKRRDEGERGGHGGGGGGGHSHKKCKNKDKKKGLCDDDGYFDDPHHPLYPDGPDGGDEHDDHEDDDHEDEDSGVKMNKICKDFNSEVNKLLEWTVTYMPVCCFEQKKKNSPGQIKCTSNGFKFTKKWTKIMGAFTGGARNQYKAEGRPENLCDETFEPEFTHNFEKLEPPKGKKN